MLSYVRGPEFNKGLKVNDVLFEEETSTKTLPIGTILTTSDQDVVICKFPDHGWAELLSSSTQDTVNISYIPTAVDKTLKTSDVRGKHITDLLNWLAATTQFDPGKSHANPFHKGGVCVRQLHDILNLCQRPNK